VSTTGTRTGTGTGDAVTELHVTPPQMRDSVGSSRRGSSFAANAGG
jgi:hypothetical protein